MDTNICITQTITKNLFRIILIVLTCITLCGIRSCEKSVKATKAAYEVYNENYRDTIYVEKPKTKYNCYYMNGLQSGIVQKTFWSRAVGSYIVSIRSFTDSKVIDYKIGQHDYNVLNYGDTILNNTINIIHDTIYRVDTITIHIENKNTKAKSYVLNGLPTGIVVEGSAECGDGGKNDIIPSTAKLVIRDLKTSKLSEISVGKYDYIRINLGDTIYGK